MSNGSRPGTSTATEVTGQPRASESDLADVAAAAVDVEPLVARVAGAGAVGVAAVVVGGVASVVTAVVGAVVVAAVVVAAVVVAAVVVAAAVVVSAVVVAGGEVGVVDPSAAGDAGVAIAHRSAAAKPAITAAGAMNTALWTSGRI
jgi:hypothetical protein